MQELQVLGLCRWSYPAAPGAFRKDAGETLAETRAALYARERMELRLFYLEHVVIPCLEAQTDPDFTVIMVMGQGLPEPFRKRVLALIARVPQIVPRFLPEGLAHQQVCLDEMRLARQAGVAAVAEFRIDDDDAVAVDFVARTRAQFAALRELFEAEGKLALDFNRGFILKTNADGVNVLPVVARYWTPGLVIFLPGDSPQSLLNFHHARMWKRVTMLCWPRQPMFVRGAHGQNDSSINENPHNSNRMADDPMEIPALVHKRFGIDLAALELAWNAVRGD
ncbi:glycosyltransferase [Aquicoccus sp. G2-2]|uniref:glycosyltransferase n=1 Tax=Aquicoccus sp. G2-2 TaxID=3092120 RepID=UPI002AE056B5|nr:glycosyltransferase [Aquicoccus sp. G2-2]MEA1114112.1 glycosyltransferase [Aquicoccus sp. G2-2]